MFWVGDLDAVGALNIGDDLLHRLKRPHRVAAFPATFRVLLCVSVWLRFPVGFIVFDPHLLISVFP